ncbi:MAG: hypothetical protein ACRBCL_07900 [Maritimibacter sp.]
MFLIALTSFPPRYSQLPQALTALLDQHKSAARILLTLPKRPARSAPAPLPNLPMGVTVIETEDDLGPAGKLLGAARAHPDTDILICDDDWLYGPHWSACFLEAARNHPGAVIAGSTWASERIGHQGGTVLQGFAGAFIPGTLTGQIPPPPPEAWAVDDIWISGALQAAGATIHPCDSARAQMSPLPSANALQNDPTRDTQNRAAAQAVHDRFDLWPKI